MRKCNKWLWAALAATMLSAMAGGCAPAPKEETKAAEANGSEPAATEGSSPEASGKTGLQGEIEIVTNANEATYQAINGIFQKFMEENPGVTINYTTQESDYEQLMKARMASADLPDMFATHGWSVARYSEYLRPLNDQPWYDTVQDSFFSIIENDNKEIFVLPLNIDQGGIFYNKGLLKELGAEVPATWDEFMAICEMGREKGYTGVFVAGKDSRQPANVLDIAATTLLASCEDKGYTGQLAGGGFDWNNWAPVSQLLVDMKDKGYLNVDSVTCDPVDIPERLAENTTLFLISSTQDLIRLVKEINPEAEYGMAPIPALNGNYEPVFCGGEREAYGIWKNTEHEDICLAVLEYLAKPEHVKLVCEASGKLPAIKNVTPDLGTVSDDYKKYETVAMYPFFDRVYLPNGMWSTLKTIGSALIAGEMTVEESVKAMETDYNTLRTQ